jgi:hypothetical protein
MSLILAIEPDRRQASRVAALVKNRLHAEIVSANTTEHAIEALAGRVPDLILTSLLLSPKDDAALSDWLRASDEAGAHVQTLVIPVLGSSQSSGGGSGLFSRLTGRAKDDDTPGGCDPEIFANQIREYLDRAAEERRTAAEDLALAGKPPIALPPVSRSADAMSTSVDSEPPIYFEVEAVLPEPVDATAYASTEQPFAGDPDMFDGDQEGPWSEISLGEEDAEAGLRVEDAEGRRGGLDDDGASLELDSEQIDLQRFVEELSADAPSPKPIRRPDDVVADFEEALDVIASPEAASESEPNRPGEHSEADSDLWMPLDGPAASWPRLEGGVIKASATGTAALEAERPAPTRERSRKRPKTSPLHQEWSVFDPEQCGFSALLAKLDQMSDDAA